MSAKRSTAKGKIATISKTLVKAFRKQIINLLVHVKLPPAGCGTTLIFPKRKQQVNNNRVNNKAQQNSPSLRFKQNKTIVKSSNNLGALKH